MTSATKTDPAADKAAADNNIAKAAADKLKADAKAKLAADAKAKKDADTKVKADAKAAADKVKADAKAAKQAASDAAAKLAADAKAKKDVDKAAAEQAKVDAKAAKEAAKQPEQNGVRRPKAEGLCGQAWTLFDSMSRGLGRPVPIADVLAEGGKQKLNPGNMRTEYARWKKFNGISGQVAKTVVTPPVAAPAPAPAA